MTKQAFLDRLQENLKGLPKEETDEQVAFYQEMIEDRMEDGISEEQAVEELGSVEEIAKQIIRSVPLTKIIKETTPPTKSLKPKEWILLTLGFPLWFPLLLSVFAVVVSVYLSLWAIIISLWAVFGSLAGCTLAGVFGGVQFLLQNNLATGLVFFAAALVCGGLSIFFFFANKATTKGSFKLTQKGWFALKCRFLKKEAQE